MAGNVLVQRAQVPGVDALAELDAVSSEEEAEETSLRIAVGRGANLLPLALGGASTSVSLLVVQGVRQQRRRSAKLRTTATTMRTRKPRATQRCGVCSTETAKYTCPADEVP